MKPSTQAEQLFALESRAVPTVSHFVCPPELRGTWTGADGDLAMYRLLVSNAMWFATQRDGYSSGEKEHLVYVQAGSMKRCSENYYRRAAEFALAHPSARVAATGHTVTTAETPTVAGLAILNRVRECLCLKCLETELTARFALRGGIAFHAAEQTEEIPMDKFIQSV
jgi:hypothetical protein